MKKYIILFCTLFCVLSCFSELKYHIQETHYAYDILIVFTNNDSKNKLLVDEILNDTLIYKCISMNVAGNFTKFPSNFHKISWIKEMQISSKKPFVIDSQFSAFNKLELLLVFSKIKHVDKSVRLPKLKNIWFQYSKLKEFPLAICFWHSLTSIDIQGCNFGTLPKEIGNLQELERLNLSINNISFLPNEFYSLQKLKSVGLSNNSLITISDSICNMKSLEWICLDDNKKLTLDETIKKCLANILQTLY